MSRSSRKPLSRWTLLAALCAALSAPGVDAASQTYAAREGNLFAGVQLTADTGGPQSAGLEGDLFEQILSYTASFQGIYEEQTVTWDENTEQLVGFTENATSAAYTALESERVTWKFTSGDWAQMTTVATTIDGSTGLIERTPLVTPVIAPPGGGGGGGGGGGSTPLTDLELMELEMTGFDYAMRQYLDPNYSLAGITREQLAADLARLEAVLAGNYTPPDVPEPGTWGLLAVGGLVMLATVRKRARPSTSTA